MAIDLTNNKSAAVIEQGDALVQLASIGRQPNPMRLDSHRGAREKRTRGLRPGPTNKSFCEFFRVFAGVLREYLREYLRGVARGRTSTLRESGPYNARIALKSPTLQ